MLSEAEVEQTLLDQLAILGWQVLDEAACGPDGTVPERQAYSETILMARLQDAIARLNPDIPEEARTDALRQIVGSGRPTLVEENRRLHRLLVEGVAVEYRAEDSTIRGDSVRLLDRADRQNDWLAISQFTVIEDGHNRRPDVVLFLNGLPIAVVEVKKPGAEAATLAAAFRQLQTYKREIPSLFRSNAVLVTTDGVQARIGSLTADIERFMHWRTTDGAGVAPKGTPEMPVLVEGVFERARFLSLMLDFTVFRQDAGGTAKIIAGYHQFHATKKAVVRTIAASRQGGDGRAGVIWHTQGSGKSLLMAFAAGQLVQAPEMANPTIIVLTDRNDLDNQLFATFAACRDLVRQTPGQADSRAHLQELLRRASGGVIFTTMQKFAPEAGCEFPLISERHNIVVMADEAHRSQYGFAAKTNRTTGEVTYGFAKYLRDALPHAAFIGFTGTPIEADDVNTPAVFGDYIDIYDIARAVEDGATVPIYYESRLARIELPEDGKPRIDAEVEELTEDAAAGEEERLKRKWATVEALVGTEKRLALVAADIVEHFESRLAAMDGKGMIVCMSRRICVALYAQIVKLRPDWHSDDDKAGAVKVVMTGSASDPESWQVHVGGKARRDELARRMKDADDPLKLVLVCDMWLTGFDAPALHTMYVDKPMRGHGLMQAIARVNRVFRDKPAGLVVDYIGIAQNLKKALRQYSKGDQEQTGIDEAEAVALLLEKLDVVRGMFHGLDYRQGLSGTPAERLQMLATALDWILAQQAKAVQAAEGEAAKKAAGRRFPDAVLALAKAFALAAASDAAREVRDEVSFFQTVRAAMAKADTRNGESSAERDLAIRQIVDGAVVSTEIVDILSAAGLSSPDISILSDEFLADVAQMEKKNLALEAMKKLLGDEIRSRSKANIVEGRKFSERLQASIARYHNNAISTVEVLQELIDLAKEVREARKRGEESGLTPAEVAFYDALADNDSAMEVLGDAQLRIIAQELMNSLQKNVSIDWARRESARARLRVLVKRILRKYGYPPDLQDAAVRGVLAQAEALLSGMVG